MNVLESALYAENLEETADFYKDVLGLAEITRSQGRHVFFRAGWGVVLLFRPTVTRQPRSASMVASLLPTRGCGTRPRHARRRASMALVSSSAIVSIPSCRGFPPSGCTPKTDSTTVNVARQRT